MTGTIANATAIILRCNMPPESWYGYFLSTSNGLWMCIISRASTMRPLLSFSEKADVVARSVSRSCAPME